jgi:hypothetical protein
VQQQLGQQHAVLDAAEPEQPVTLACLERAEEKELDRAYHHADLLCACRAWVIPRTETVCAKWR